MLNTNAYHVKLEGDSYSVGQSLGKMVQTVPGLRDAHVLPAPAFSKQDEGKVLKLFERFCPGLNEEIAGFCDVLKVPMGQALYYSISFMKPGCSQMALLPSKTASGHTILARNYDFSEKLDDMTLCTTKIRGKYAHLGSSSVLFGRCDGMNECGLAVSMTSAGLPVSNQQYAVRKPMVEGLNFWAVVRTVLENCADVDEAVELTRDMPIAFNLNLMVADKMGEAALIETYDGKYAYKLISKDTPEQYLCSTNHVCLPELERLEPKKLKNSLVRYDVMNKTISRKNKLSEAEIRSLLSTRYPEGLCCDYYDEFLGTLRSIIFDVNKARMRLCFGSPDINEWYEFGIDEEVTQPVYPVKIRKAVIGQALFEMI